MGKDLNSLSVKTKDPQPGKEEQLPSQEKEIWTVWKEGLQQSYKNKVVEVLFVFYLAMMIYAIFVFVILMPR